MVVVVVVCDFWKVCFVLSVFCLFALDTHGLDRYYRSIAPMCFWWRGNLIFSGEKEKGGRICGFFIYSFVRSAYISTLSIHLIK